MIVADTDVLVDFLAGRGPGADRIALELERGDLRTTVISRFELLAGARSERQMRAVNDLLAAIPNLPLGPDAADLAAQIRRNLDASGEAIGMADCLIAAIVCWHDGLLLTRNRRHFERVPGLRLSSLPV